MRTVFVKMEELTKQKLQILHYFNVHFYPTIRNSQPVNLGRFLMLYGATNNLIRQSLKSIS